MDNQKKKRTPEQLEQLRKMYAAQGLDYDELQKTRKLGTMTATFPRTEPITATSETMKTPGGRADIRRKAKSALLVQGRGPATTLAGKYADQITREAEEGVRPESDPAVMQARRLRPTPYVARRGLEKGYAAGGTVETEQGPMPVDWYLKQSKAVKAELRPSLARGLMRQDTTEAIPDIQNRLNETVGVAPSGREITRGAIPSTEADVLPAEPTKEAEPAGPPPLATSREIDVVHKAIEEENDPERRQAYIKYAKRRGIQLPARVQLDEAAGIAPETPEQRLLKTQTMLHRVRTNLAHADDPAILSTIATFDVEGRKQSFQSNAAKVFVEQMLAIQKKAAAEPEAGKRRNAGAMRDQFFKLWNKAIAAEAGARKAEAAGRVTAEKEEKKAAEAKVKEARTVKTAQLKAQAAVAKGGYDRLDAVYTSQLKDAKDAQAAWEKEVRIGTAENLKKDKDGNLPEYQDPNQSVLAKALYKKIDWKNKASLWNVFEQTRQKRQDALDKWQKLERQHIQSLTPEGEANEPSREEAERILDEAGGDVKKAEEIARRRGYKI